MRLDARSQQGQVLLVAALLIPIMLGMAALAVDIGTYAGERRTLQNAADSIALAAARGLPNTTSVNSLANQWAAKNNIDPADMTVTVLGGSTTPTVRVTITRSHEFSFIRALGITEKDVAAVAAAQKLSLVTGTGIVPWSITEETVNASTSGTEVIIKYDTDENGYGQGNFGAIRIDGNGSSDYESAAKYGSDSNICARGTPGCTTSDCPGTYPTTCAENSPECDGDQCPPKTGNMVGPTKDAVDFRMDNTSAECDTFEEAFASLSTMNDLDLLDKYVSIGGGAPRHHGSGSHPTYTPSPSPTRTNTPLPTNTPTQTSTPLPPTATNTPLPPTATKTPGGPTDTPTASPPPSATPTPWSGGGGPAYGLNPDCNPWSGGACPPAPSTEPCSRRVFLIPIVDSFGNGSSDPLTIIGFALVYLEGYDGSCTGNSCDIRARFIRAHITTGGLTGAYDPNAAVHVVKLTE